MRFVATVSHEDGCFVARCLELDMAGEGETQEQAVESLRLDLEAYLHRSDAVAPPSQPHVEPVEIVVRDDSGELHGEGWS